MAVNMSTTAVTSDGTFEHAVCSDTHEFRTRGQVGQESNLQPAVLEPAAVRSATFRDVHDGGWKSAHFDRSKYVEVHQRSPALGSKLGSKQPSVLIPPGRHLGVKVNVDERFVFQRGITITSSSSRTTSAGLGIAAISRCIRRAASLCTGSFISVSTAVRTAAGLTSAGLSRSPAPLA